MMMINHLEAAEMVVKEQSVNISSLFRHRMLRFGLHMVTEMDLLDFCE